MYVFTHLGLVMPYAVIKLVICGALHEYKGWGFKSTLGCNMFCHKNFGYILKNIYSLVKKNAAVCAYL